MALDPECVLGIAPCNFGWLTLFIDDQTRPSGIDTNAVDCFRMPYTMFVSAFWHGIHPGYFLSFLTIPLCTAAEDALFKAVPLNKKGSRPVWFQYM